MVINININSRFGSSAEEGRFQSAEMAEYVYNNKIH
jgi:hypothetical protein